jgi:hypothetical protein
MRVCGRLAYTLMGDPRGGKPHGFLTRDHAIGLGAGLGPSNLV